MTSEHDGGGGACALAVMLGIESSARDAWAAAAEESGVRVVAATSAAEAGYALANHPAVLLVHGGTPFLQRCADPADPQFGAAAIAVLDGDDRSSPWYGVAWDTIPASATIEESASMLRAGIAESRSRLGERDMVVDYHRRRALLTEKEEAVLTAVCNGRLNKQIARDLNVSVRTIEQRRRRIFDKMGVESAVPLAKLAAVVQTLETKAQRARRRTDLAQTPRPLMANNLAIAPRAVGVSLDFGVVTMASSSA